MDGPGRTAIRRARALHPATKRQPGHRRRLRRLMRETAAVTPVVGTIMILAISAFGIGIVMAWGLPSLQQTQAEAEVDAVIDQFYSLEEMLQNIMRTGASGKASSGAISFSAGELTYTRGNLLVASGHHDVSLLIDPSDEADRFRTTILDDGDPYVIEVQAIAGDNPDPNVSQRHVEVHSVDPDGEKQIASKSNWDSDHKITFTVPHAASEDGTLRLRVMHAANPAVGEPHPFPLAESWVLPLGAIEYNRETQQGSTTVILEMGSVVTTYDSGSYVQTDPVMRRETDPQGNTRFVSVFAPTMVAPAGSLESTGPGTHPIRLLLNLNMLQIPGMDAWEADLHVVGPRAEVWYEYFEDRHGWTLIDGTEPGTTQRAIMTMDNETPFEFALMESRVHAEMQSGVTRIS